MINFFRSQSPVPYHQALQKTEEFKKKVPCVWFLEHLHMYSLGNRGKLSDINNIHNLPVFASSRGGEVTYHGPGQLIVYGFFNLNELSISIDQYVKILEDGVLGLLQHFEIKGERGPHPGIWVNNAKIASIGIRVQNHITSHGVAINIHNDLKYFDCIKTCGMKNFNVTSIKASLDNAYTNPALLFDQSIKGLETYFKGKCQLQ